MKLKSLQISGFKSFADKTTINFEDGITGIVGPNGSGKSNIIEAVRWVMGEQSAKSLRGGKMPDIIFAGSENRQPLNRAAVTITFDNEDHFLKTDYTEVSVTRKLFRNGESQYLINQNECRLKDILDLFMDTGLGRDSFSVISQGRVEAIFNSKPEDRRVIIEEVAGVLSYKQDKQKAESELAKTNGYLDRVSDLIAELQSQLEPLEEQSSLAQDYVDQKKQFDKLEKTRLVHSVETLQQQNGTVGAKLAEAKRLVTQYQTQKKQLLVKVSELKTKRQTLEEKKDQLQADLLSATRKYENLSGQQNVDSEKNKYQQEQVAQLEQTIASAKQKLADLAVQKDQVDQTLADKQTLVAQLKTQLVELSPKGLQQKQTQVQQEIDRLQATYIEKMQALAQVHNEQVNLKKSYEQDSQQQLHVNADLLKLKSQLTTAQEKQTAQQKQVTELDLQRKQAEADLKAALQSYQKLAAQQKQSQDSWLDAVKIYQQAKTRLETLSSSDVELRSYYQGVQNVLKHKAQFTGLVGVVSELLEVPAKYTKAIETVLGGQLQQLVTQTDRDARQIISYLTQHKAGRVTLLPLTAIRAKYLSATVQKELAQLPGVEGIGADLVKTTTELQLIKQHLLGNVVVATDLKQATQISKALSTRLKIVTLNGEIINPSGSMTGGINRHQSAGLLTQKQSRVDLERQVKQMQRQLTSREALVTDLKQQLAQAEQKGSEARQKYNQNHDAYKDAQTQLEIFSNQQTDLKRRYEAVAYESGQNGDLEHDYTTQSEKLKQQETQLNHELNQLSSQTEGQKQTLDNLHTSQAEGQKQVEQTQAKLTDAQVALAQTQTVQTNLQANIENSKQTLAVAEKQHTSLIEARKSRNRQHQTTQQELDASQQQIKTLQDQLERQKQQAAQVAETLSTNEDDLQRVQELDAVASEDLQTTQIEKTRLTEQIDHALADLSEKYHLSFEMAKQEAVELEPEELQRQLKLAKKSLAEIGEVNVGAIDEYKRVSERYQFLTTQKDDLMTSQKQLLETINEIDTEAASRFKATFDKISASFSKVFVKMFGGGKAKLELTDPEHLLTTGMEIKAQPPGKKFQRLSLLSGGERALTAITLLFSILEVNPVPFCILDEVEAAFDDANVTRFADYLRNFRHQTQFVVITHRKGTMVECDVLYGVTMQESGVSKMASVSLEEVSRKETATQ
ncbi:chromosome segregation protein SMC [Pediococcus siamensis]|uniref:chromosome segregation protein SMC n=1 Tax=Pediococcus siamensis TaxID=381829 RepID=UPI0039A0DE58